EGHQTEDQADLQGAQEGIQRHKKDFLKKNTFGTARYANAECLLRGAGAARVVRRRRCMADESDCGHAQFQLRTLVADFKNSGDRVT
ncbi:hypothetical protein ACSTIY_00250, partial [Vibrio parahaemolyticus]